MPSILTETQQSYLNKPRNMAKDSFAFLRQYLRKRLPTSDFSEAYRRFRYLRRKHSLEVGEFYDSRLWRKDLSEEQWSSFIGWRKHIQTLCNLNPIPYRGLTENKLVFYKLCDTAGISYPRIFGVLDPDDIAADSSGDISILHNVSELPGFLEREGINEFVMKPTNGTKGRAVEVLGYEGNGKIVASDGRQLSATELQSMTEYEYREVQQLSFLLQERVLPHESTRELSPDCALSYRVHTIMDDDGTPYNFGTYAKLPGVNEMTDNFANRGLVCMLDDNGRCFGASAEETVGTLLTHHPDWDFNLVGWEPPFYDEVCEFAERLARTFWYVRCIAWDIAVSSKGIVVYEGNNPWNMNIQDDYDYGLWRGKFAEIAGKALKTGPDLPPWWG